MRGIASQRRDSAYQRWPNTHDGLKAAHNAHAERHGRVDDSLLAEQKHKRDDARDNVGEHHAGVVVRYRRRELSGGDSTVATVIDAGRDRTGRRRAQRAPAEYRVEDTLAPGDHESRAHRPKARIVEQPQAENRAEQHCDGEPRHTRRRAARDKVRGRRERHGRTRDEHPAQQSLSPRVHTP